MGAQKRKRHVQGHTVSSKAGSETRQICHFHMSSVSTEKLQGSPNQWNSPLQKELCADFEDLLLGITWPAGVK